MLLSAPTTTTTAAREVEVEGVGGDLSLYICCKIERVSKEVERDECLQGGCHFRFFVFLNCRLWNNYNVWLTVREHTYSVCWCYSYALNTSSGLFYTHIARS